MAAFVDFHCCAQAIFSPYEHIWKRPKDYDDQMRVMNKMVDAIDKAHGSIFEYGPSAKVNIITTFCNPATRQVKN